MAITGLGLDHGNRKIGTVAQNIVRALLLAPARPAADNDDPAIRERPLLVDCMGPIIPTRRLQLRDDKFAAGIGLVHKFRLAGIGDGTLYMTPIHVQNHRIGGLVDKRIFACVTQSLSTRATHMQFQQVIGPVP